jgi:hypothetical protein
MTAPPSDRPLGRRLLGVAWLLTRAIHSRASLPSFAALLAYGVGFVVTRNEHPSDGFYEAASQIIPVLFLVLVLEARLLRVHVIDPPQPSQSLLDYMEPTYRSEGVVLRLAMAAALRAGRTDVLDEIAKQLERR